MHTADLFTYCKMNLRDLELDSQSDTLQKFSSIFASDVHRPQGVKIKRASHVVEWGLMEKDFQILRDGMKFLQRLEEWHSLSRMTRTYKFKNFK